MEPNSRAHNMASGTNATNYNNIKELSQYDTGVTAEYGDHFITLSTCVYHVENGRFVVVAKEVEPGDSYLPLTE